MTNYELIFLKTCDSTQDFILKNIQKIRHKSIVYTFNQINGRGRKGNFWESEPFKNLTFSVKYDLDLEINQYEIINNAILNGMLDFIKKYIPHARLKLPNDILVDGKKICGILIENIIIGNKIQNSIIGIGLNVNQKKFNIETASSMSIILNQEFNLENLLNEIVESIDKKMFL